jgi:hypothetical protein
MFLRKSGTSQVSISLDTSVKKLVSVSAQTFSGNDRVPRGVRFAVARDSSPRGGSMNFGSNTRHPCAHRQKQSIGSLATNSSASRRERTIPPSGPTGSQRSRKGLQ